MELCFYFLDLGHQMFKQFSTDLQSWLLKGSGQAYSNMGRITHSFNETHRSQTWSRRLDSVWTVTEECWNGVKWINELEDENGEVDEEDGEDDD